LLLAILQFFAVINIVRTQVAVDTMITVLMLAGSAAGYLGAVLTRLPRDLQTSLLSQLSIVGYPTDRVLRYVEDDPLKPQRATGTSIDPNSFGGLLVLVVALLVTQLVSAKPLLPRWFLGLLLLGPLFSLYLTYSRGSQLGAIAVIGFVALLKYRKIFLYALPVLVVGAIWLPSTFLGARLAQGFALEDQATVLRLAEYQNALDVIGNHPWFGVGFGSIATLNVTVPVSMIYLTIAERMGLIGLALFLVLMFLFLSYALTRLGRLKVDRQQANLLGLTGGVIGALAVGLLDHYFFNGEFSHMATLLWLFMGLAVVQVKIGEVYPGVQGPQEPAKLKTGPGPSS
jgi:O-antigen ligase